MRIQFLLLSIVLIISANACGVRVEEGPDMSDILSEMEQDKFVYLTEIPKEKLKIDIQKQFFEVLGVRYEDKTLFVDVQYGGGCKEHPFEAFCEANLTLDEPFFIYLEDQEQGDMCRALIQETIQIGIGALIDKRESPLQIYINKEEYFIQVD